jgi:Domain of unknown function (DUF4386)
MTSLSSKARMAGLLYLVFSLIGVVRLIYVPNSLFVQGDAGATANNIVMHESLFRWGIVCYLVAAAGWIFVTLALYRLLREVDEKLAALMVILGGLVVVPIFFMNSLNDVAALLLARGSDFLTVVDKPQRDALAMLFLRLHHYGDAANEIFWGLWLIPLGLLVYRSRFLPRFLGVWLMAACFGYLALSLSGFLFPQFEGKVFSYTQPLTIGELAFMLWLLIMGAKEQDLAAAS